MNGLLKEPETLGDGPQTNQATQTNQKVDTTQGNRHDLP
jgi:hypothetical protein